MYRFTKLIWPVLALALLAGCASKQVTRNKLKGDFLAHANTVQQTKNWTIDGKMGVRNGDEATSFNLFWAQDDEQFNLRLTGPMGQGAVTIEGLPGRVTMTSNQGVQNASSLEELLKDNTDLDLPLAHLLYWVRGLPNPDHKAGIRFNNAGLLEELQQDGWQVTYTEYHDMAPPLPRKFKVVNEKKSAKVVIKKWEFDS